MHPSCKSRKENIYLGAFYGVVGSYIALYLVHLGYQYYLVRARCLKYTILSAPLHPHFGNIALYCAIFQALYTPDLPPPARISSPNLNVGWNMMYAPLLQI